MIKKFDGAQWNGVKKDVYKDEPGTWQGVAKHVLASSPNAQHETRVFEFSPGGYSSHEHHVHEHSVLILEGSGEVLIEGEWTPVQSLDFIHVGPNVVHQFRAGESGMKIVCIVDRERDKPILVPNE